MISKIHSTYLFTMYVCALSLSPLPKPLRQWLQPPPVRNHTETRQKIVRQRQINNLLTALVGALCSNAAAGKSISNSNKNSPLVREHAEP